MSLQRVIAELGKFPGIGRKTARRLGFHLLDSDPDEVRQLADSLIDLVNKVGHCTRCHNIAEGDLCIICNDNRRDETTLCVVEGGMDVLIFERMGAYNGQYHVLGGVISPLDGVSPDDLHLDDLFERLSKVKELIIATNPSIEGDTTALFIARQSEKYSIKITRLARGLPMGTNLEYTDDATLASAYTARVEI